MTAFRHCLLLLFCAATLKGTDAPPPAPPGMIHIPGGEYKPLYARAAQPRMAPSFFMGSVPVTNADYLAFVVQHPEWLPAMTPTSSISLPD